MCFADMLLLLFLVALLLLSDAKEKLFSDGGCMCNRVPLCTAHIIEAHMQTKYSRAFHTRTGGAMDCIDN